MGGLAGTVVVLILYAEFVLLRVTKIRPDMLQHFLFALVGGIVLSIASQFGDWLASVIKRRSVSRILASFCLDMVVSWIASTARFLQCR